MVPDVPGLPVGELGAHPVQRFLLPRELRFGDNVPTLVAHAHEVTSVVGGTISNMSPTVHWNKPHNDSMAAAHR